MGIEFKQCADVAMFGYKHDLIKRKTGFLDAFEGIAIRRCFGERAVIDKGGRDRAVPQIDNRGEMVIVN